MYPGSRLISLAVPHLRAVSQAIVLSLAEIKLFPIPIIDCFLIISVNKATALCVDFAEGSEE